MKDLVVDLILEHVDLSREEVEGLIEVPPRLEMGDFAFPCFSLAKKMGKVPVQVAEEILRGIGSEEKGIRKVEAKGPYVNFFVDREIFSKNVLKKIGEWKVEGGEQGKKILIDMSSPNIAKPFGIGHLRSTIIGNAIGNICEACGAEVVRINYLGDWGTQFGKIIMAWRKWGSEEELERDAIAHLQELYVKANSSDEFDDEARAEFKKLEEGEVENVALWKRFREMSLKEFDKIYDFLGVEFDVIGGESLYNEKMGGVISELEENGLLVEDQGARVVDLESEGLGKVLIQKGDGTSLYVTRDLASAIDRKKEYDFDRVIYEVGSEQKLHFRQVFGVLKKMGYDWADDLKHVAHGLYLDKDGKKFATRRGKTVYMKDVLDEVYEKARSNLEVRGLVDDEVLDERARKVAIAAIFYGDLKNDREHNMVFDIDRFLSFEGDTGPYLLYSYARASTLLSKLEEKGKGKGREGLKDVDDFEFALVKRVGEFEDVLKKAYGNLAPNLIANYCYELAKEFNEFYHACPVLGGDKEGFRLEIVRAFRERLGMGLDLLGIETLEEM